MMMERSLVIMKPDAVQRNLVGEIISRFERKGLKIVGLKMMRLDEAVVKEHYAHHAEKDFFKDLSQFMRSNPVVVLVLEGFHAVEIVRAISGIKSSDMGSIRGDYVLSTQKNIIHSSDSVETARKEVPRFFEKSELFEYEKHDWHHVLSDEDLKNIGK